MALNKVQTKYGTVTGIPGGAGNTVFKGVPYAKPPVGERRFMAPQEPDPWEGEFVCDRFRDGAVQYTRRTTMDGAVLKWEGRKEGGKKMTINPSKHPLEPMFSEDCLYLNIWTPAASADAKLPVLFWIYGGGFNSGYSWEDTYDGDYSNSRGVIVVTVGYRVGVMGFLTHPALTERDPQHARGNLGLLDQIAAMRWVRENIAAFGGDPERVTIHGQSAGGMSTKFHLVSPLSRGLFRRAIVQSGGGLNGGDPTRPAEELADITQTVLEHIGWTVEDLLTRPAEEVTDMMADNAEILCGKNDLFMYQPCVDGLVLPEVPEIPISEGRIHPGVDVICGTVTGDSWMFSRKVRSRLMDDPDSLRAFAYSPEVAWGRHNARAGYPPIRAYFFERKLPGDERGTPHGSELAYIFGTLDRFGRAWTDYDYHLMDVMNRYWVNFAETGDPNGGNLPEWPFFTADAPLVLHVTDSGIAAEDIVENERQNHVIEFTIAHPGFLETLDDF